MAHVEIAKRRFLTILSIATKTTLCQAAKSRAVLAVSKRMRPRLRWGDSLLIRADVAHAPLGADVGAAPAIHVDVKQVM
jgi:hypothetical protein